MSVSLQKANFWKRISAYLFDLILTVTLAVGFATVVSAIVGYDAHSAKLEGYYAQYAEEYGIDLDISQEDYDALSEAEKQNYEAASDALAKDPEVLKLYNTMFYLTLAILAIGLFLAILALHFIVPLFFKNGQTLGKKIFGVAVMRTNCVKVSNPVLFVRSILGLYTIETMVPLLLLTMIYFGAIGSVGSITIGLIMLLQIVVMAVTQTNSSIHDLLSDTVVVDFASQKIFDTEEALIAYKEALHAQEVAAQKEQGNISSD
ncbi:MAG: RDD family protein [Clostridia bacterium]|nr:RDD family protein [Clostridia bacterium]